MSDTVVKFIFMSIYTIYAVWQINRFKGFADGFFGTAALISGSIAIYMLEPVIVAAALWLLKVGGAVFLFLVIIGAFSEG